MQPSFGTVRQIAYVVTDLEASIRYWVSKMNAGPFFLFEHAQLENAIYRGAPSDAEISLAVGNSGDLQIEFIQCENDSPSVYREFLEAGRAGVHHLGLMPEHYADTCQSYRDAGFEAAFECSIGGTSLVYFDTVQSLGHFTELWDRSDSFINFMAQVKLAAQSWNGEEPIRTAGL